MNQATGKILLNLKISTNQEFLQPNQIRLYKNLSDFERKYYVITIEEGANIPVNSTISNLALHLHKGIKDWSSTPEQIEGLIWSYLGGVKCE